jgi:solute carrier family 45 protein 1/2/4
MLGGSIAIAICYLILGWAKEIAAWFVEDAESVRAGSSETIISMRLTAWQRRQYAIALAVMDIYVLDFMINVCTIMTTPPKLL